jgi:hypothetical protein
MKKLVFWKKKLLFWMIVLASITFVYSYLTDTLVVWRTNQGLVENWIESTSQQLETLTNERN